PNQIYNGLNRNLNRETMIHFNNATTKKAMPTNGDNLVPAISQPIIEVEKNEEVEAASKEVFYKAALEEIVSQTEGFEREISPEASIEITSEMKRQQHKNKEALSLFNLFRRKS